MPLFGMYSGRFVAIIDGVTTVAMEATVESMTVTGLVATPEEEKEEAEDRIDPGVEAPQA